MLQYDPARHFKGINMQSRSKIAEVGADESSPKCRPGLLGLGLCDMPALLAMPEDTEDTRSSAPLSGSPMAPSRPLPTPNARPPPLPVL